MRTKLFAKREPKVAMTRFAMAIF